MNLLTELHRHYQDIKNLRLTINGMKKNMNSALSPEIIQNEYELRREKISIQLYNSLEKAVEKELNVD